MQRTNFVLAFLVRYRGDCTAHHHGSLAANCVQMYVAAPPPLSAQGWVDAPRNRRVPSFPRVSVAHADSLLTNVTFYVVSWYLGF